MKKVACVGILVADVIVQPVKDYPEKGQLVPVDSITIHNGGNAMTASINLRRMGVETKIIGKVGMEIVLLFALGPIIEKLIHYEHSESVARLIKILRLWIVRESNRVKARFL